VVSAGCWWQSKKKGNWVFLGLSAETIERREVLDEISGGPHVSETKESGAQLLGLMRVSSYFIFGWTWYMKTQVQK
jgi:hypothetical protein